MAAFNSGSPRVATQYNFIGAQELHKPDIDPVLALRYGSQSLMGLMEMFGNSKETHAEEYTHFEEDWIMPKLKATTAGAGAGASATFTLHADALSTLVGNISPFNATSTTQLVPVVVGDVLLIKPASGTVSASTYIRARVDSVNASAGTFTAIPIKSTESIPAIGTATEIIIFTNAFGEGSSQPLSRSSKVIKYTNNLQIFRNNWKITGTEDKQLLWIDVDGVPYWTAKGEDDLYKMHNNYVEQGLLLSDKITNVTNISIPAFTAGNPIAMTEGLIPFILSNGTISNYSSVTGWTLQDAETLTVELDKQRASKENFLMCGIQLSLQIDRELGDRFQKGGVVFGNYNADQDKWVSLRFDRFTVGNYTFHKRTYDAFNYLPTLGADGYGFPFEGMVLPMDNTTINMDGSRTTIPSLRFRYLPGRKPQTAVTPLYNTTGEDAIDFRYLSECGFEGTAGNRFAYIKKV